jgi:hypothetical protein
VLAKEAFEPLVEFLAIAAVVEAAALDLDQHPFGRTVGLGQGIAHLFRLVQGGDLVSARAAMGAPMTAAHSSRAGKRIGDFQARSCAGCNTVKVDKKL